jgi:hypothetical protein
VPNDLAASPGSSQANVTLHAARTREIATKGDPLKPHKTIDMSSAADQVAQRWHIKIDPAISPIEDIFRPEYWVNCQKLGNGDRIRVEAVDGSYDFELRVDAKTIAGKLAIRVSIFPNLPDYVIAAASASSEMVPA